MATWLQSLGNLNNNLTDKFMAGGIGKGLSSLGVTSGSIGGIANTIGQIGTGLLAGQNQTGVGNALQTIGGLASNIPGVGGLIGAGVGVVGGLVNAAFGSHINDEFVQQTQLGANQVGSQVFNANTNGDLLNDWQNMTQMSNVSKSEVGSDGWFSSAASDKTDELNRRIDEANRRQLANFGIAAENVDRQNDLRILQNMAAYGGPINSFRKYYSFGGPFGNYFEGEGEQSNSLRSPHVDLAVSNPWLYAKLHPSKKTKKAYEPTTFAGRISQVAGASELGQKYVDYNSSVLQQIPVVGLGISALDLGYDANRLYHNPSLSTTKDVALDAVSLLPALRKTMKGWWMKGNSGSFITEGGQIINNPRLASSLEVMLQPYRNAVNAGIYTGRAADFLDDSSAYLKEMWDHSPIGKAINEHSEGGYLSKAKALIRQNEGWREKPYKDAPKGKNWRSVGYGFNDSGFREKYPEGISKHYEHGITKKQAEEELDYFLNKAEKQLKSIYGKQWNDFTDSQKAAILDTYYQRPASVAKGSRFYKAITSGEDAGRYLGVAGYNKRNKIRQDIFGGGYSGYGDWSNTEPDNNSSSLQEVTPFTPVIHDLDLSGITPTEAKALELNLTSPTFDLSMFGKPMTTPTQQAVPTVGTVEDFLASYGDFEENLFEKGGKLNIKDMNIFDFGGGLTHGSDWDTGINWVNEGGSHGENPLGGVQMGVDEQGVPNLVEEGEAIWNGDYVFSKRMKVPKKLAKKYGLGGDMTFADAIAKLTKDSEERPLSNIDRATNDHILGEFADSQEELRMAKAQRAMDKEIQLQDDFLTGFQFGLGGHMSPLGIVPDADNISPFEKAEKLFADGGGIHIDPSKRGTFKAQASKMGMGVQEAASHILAHKENYSPEMVKKAVFAHNFAHAFGGSLFEDGGDLFSNPFAYGGELGNIFAGEGDRPNTLNLDAANQSLVRRIFGDTGFTRFMENTSAALNDPLGYFAGDEINAVIDKLGKMSEPQLERFFRTDIGRAIAPYLAGDDNSQVQESGMRGAKSVANIVRRVQRPVQIAAKKAMAQSRQIARSQMRTPKGGGSQKVLNETMTPTQAARQATTGSTEGLPQGWNFTRGNTSTVTNTSGVTGRLNPKSPTGRAAQSRGTAPDPYAGLEGSMSFGRRTPFEAAAERWGGTPADWKEISLLGGASAIGFPFVANYISDKVHNAMSEESPQANSAVQPTSATSNRGNGNKGKAAVTEIPAITPEETGAVSTRRGAQGSGRGRENGSGTATRNSGSVVPFAYDWYRNGSDGIGTPTGFKVGKNGKAYDYTPEYKALVASLGADDIRKWAAEHPNDPSLKSFLAKGNKLENLTDDQWRKGATDGKYGFMHHVADSMLGGIDEFEEVTEPATTRVAEDPEWAVDFGDPEVMRNIEAGLNPDGTPISNVGTTRNGFRPKQTWTRNLPWMMSGIMGLKEMLTPADYGNADMILDTAYRVGQPISVGTEYIGDYRRRDPFDERYLMNIINQNRAAANRNMMNFSGGNRAIGMAGILTNDLTSQMSLAEAARQAYLANRADDADVATFNKDTNKYNATAQNTRNLSLAQLNSGRQSAMLSGIAQGARLRQAIKDQRDAAIAANLSAFAQGLGDIGWENYQTNQINSLYNQGYTPYWLSGSGNTEFK